jgi:multidrug efflux pump subunit AcrA (membrane-fusion protein)
MLIAASVLFRGAGVALAMAGCVAWFGLPVWHALKSVVFLGRTAPLRLVRGGVVLTSCVMLLASFLFQMPVPFLRVAPGVVSLPEGCRVRSAVDGFIEQIHVQDGQQVTAGTLLITLRNAEITNRHADLQLQMEQETIRQQIAMKEYDAGAASIAVSNLQSLRDRLQETHSQESGLKVYAPTDGCVVADHLDWKPGVYVKEGTDLLTIDDQRSRELRVSVAQQDLSLAESRLKQSVSIRIGTRPAFQGTMMKVVPRASRRLFAPSLAATEGGDLPVMAAADDENTMQLTDRRFEAVVALDPAAASVLIGERGRVTLGSLDDSLAGYVYDQVERWLRKQIQLAVQAEREHRF